MSIIGDASCSKSDSSNLSSSPHLDCTNSDNQGQSFNRDPAICCTFDASKRGTDGKYSDAAFKCGDDTEDKCTKTSQVWYPDPTVGKDGAASYLQSKDYTITPDSLTCCPPPEYVYQLGPWAAVTPPSS